MRDNISEAQERSVDGFCSLKGKVLVGSQQKVWKSESSLSKRDV